MTRTKQPYTLKSLKRMKAQLGIAAPNSIHIQLGLRTPEEVFKKKWGAVEVVETNDPSSQAKNTVMLKDKDGDWIYAHSDNRHCYCCLPFYSAPTADLAVAMRFRDVLRSNVDRDIEVLARDQRLLQECEARINSELEELRKA